MKEYTENTEYINGLVSVITPTYKQSELLERAIKSVLRQSYSNIELLVVNDNENGDEYTNEVERIISKFDDPRLKLVCQDKHINGAAARNAGLRVARGEYVAFLDDDDYWAEKKIEKQVEAIAKLDSSWGGVTCKNVAIRDGHVCAALSTLKDGDVCKDILLRLVNISTDCILLRHSFLDQTGYFDISLKRHQEVQLLTYFTRKYKIKMVNEFLVYVDATESSNQPSVDKMAKIKEDFFLSVKPILNTFSSSEQRQIKAMHRFELGLLALRTGKKFFGFKNCLVAFRSPVTFAHSVTYIFRKVRSHFLAKSMKKFVVEEVG